MHAAVCRCYNLPYRSLRNHACDCEPAFTTLLERFWVPDCYAYCNRLRRRRTLVPYTAGFSVPPLPTSCLPGGSSSTVLHGYAVTATRTSWLTHDLLVKPRFLYSMRLAACFRYCNARHPMYSTFCCTGTLTVYFRRRFQTVVHPDGPYTRR